MDDQLHEIRHMFFKSYGDTDEPSYYIGMVLGQVAGNLRSIQDLVAADYKIDDTQIFGLINGTAALMLTLEPVLARLSAQEMKAKASCQGRFPNCPKDARQAA